MNPLLQNVVPPEGLVGILVKTITDLLKANQSLSEEHEKMRSMNQFLLWTNQILMDKLGMTNPESMNGPPSTVTDPSQLPPQMFPLLPQIPQPAGPPVTKEEIEEVSKKMDGMEEKCGKIMELLANTFGLPYLTTNQVKLASPVVPSVVPTVPKTRVPKVSSQRSAHKKKINLEGLIDKIFNDKAETSNEPSTSRATAHAIINTYNSVEIKMDQISPMLNHNVDFNGITQTTEATDPVLKAQMSILRAMLQGPQGILRCTVVPKRNQNRFEYSEIRPHRKKINMDTNSGGISLN
ncbi:hypothetical protein CAEBREN_03920 [Caenorhabditis brenneri]|uniref:Uncharacterized protein n=1 Tax=Caenorhabditis brenneri TaxID=135651 RepID=G0P4F8_CAEBE|nr:hypothetical protein CAEBREN_03920 [Caenorhabditis brenneri]